MNEESQSTIDAIKFVIEVVDSAATGSRNRRRISTVVLLDVRNALNSLPWGVILKALKKRSVSPYLLRGIEGYLKDKIICDDA